MPTLEERVAYLEGRLEDHATTVVHFRSDLQGVREEVRQLREQVDRLGERVDRLGERLDHFGERMDRRFDAIDQKFTWVVGIQVAMLVTVVGALIGSYYR